MDVNDALPVEIIDRILKLANIAEARYTHGRRSVWDAAVQIYQKTHFRSPFIQVVRRNTLIHNLWMAVKCWLMVKYENKDFPEFDFEIEVCGTERTIHLDSVKVNRNPMPNGGNVSDFFIGPAYVFMLEGSPGVIYKQQVYRICAIYVPGYNLSKEGSMGFGCPKADDVLKVRAHWFTEYKGDLTPQEVPDSDSE